MCGIAGIITIQPQPTAADRNNAEIRTMTRALAHRGPDGEAYWHSPGLQAWLGHRRLAIIDTSDAAAQPMQFADRYTIVYNGELYNYIELRDELKALGNVFRTQSDTEVLLAAYHQYGVAFLDRLDGMFAMAIWDEINKTLFLARDRFGEKPLYFTSDNDDRFLFASEMKAFWALGIVPEPDPAQLLLFTATGTTGFPLQQKETFYQHILQVPPAHYLLLQLTAGPEVSPELCRYWDIDTRAKSSAKEAAAIENLSVLLENAIRRRLRADAEIGSTLSGGVDSSTIAALAKKIRGSGLPAFSAVFPGHDKDESAFITEVSAFLGLKGYSTAPDYRQLLNDFDRMMYHQEQPVGSASVLAQFKVYQLASEKGIRVLLDGQGADELLGGYHHYIQWYLQELFRDGNLKQYRDELRQFRQAGWQGNWGWRNYLAALFPQAAQSSLIRRQEMAIRSQSNIDRRYLSGHQPDGDVFKPFVTSLNDILYHELTMSKLPELLRYTDRNSMAHGIEVRLPYLDHELVQFVFSLPASFKMRNGYTKWILRKIAEPLLPQAISWQPRKIGFEPPQARWMQEPQVRERIAAGKEKLVKKGILDKKALRLKPGAPTEQQLQSDWRYWVLSALPG